VQQPQATIIISVYRDAEALRVILEALRMQSEQDFAVIVSEDGEDPAIARASAEAQAQFRHFLHLYQEDSGFRKNRALNRAILAAPSDYLIFIDGDCVPHPHFIRGHVSWAARGIINCGRRVELGPDFSARLRAAPASTLTGFAHPLNYLRQARAMHRDGIKNYELGLYLPRLQPWFRKPTTIMGCNFSMYRDELIAINGFDEEYRSPGLGEDSDIEVRLQKNGLRMLSNKLVALQYHLHHPRSYSVTDLNKSLLERAKASASPRCRYGIDGHQ
jgi:glycosyltransferase involved in cell wall biosynthesis